MHACAECHAPLPPGEAGCANCGPAAQAAAGAWRQDGTGRWWQQTDTGWQLWSGAAADVAATLAVAPDHVLPPEEAEAETAGSGGLAREGTRRRLRLGEMLVRDGILGEATLRLALAEQEKGTPKRRLGQVLLDLGALSEEQLTLALSDRLGVDFVDLDAKPLDSALLRIIAPEVCTRLRLVPFEADEEDGSISVALADPTDVVALDDLALFSGRTMVPFAALPSAIGRALARIRDGDLLTLESDDEDTHTSRIVETLVAEAARRRASDVHIEPTGHKLVVRVRVDGRLRPILRADIDAHPKMVGRLKILSDLDISEKRRPQDGRAHFRLPGHRIDARVSTLPSVAGEKVVMRIVEKGESAPPLRESGLTGAALDRFESAISGAQGLVLISGPTGSGKTTTLYSALSQVIDPEVNVITIEDPVERELPGATQVQIDEKVGLTFPAALRSVLRQDPDIVMVGELRDLETAEITVRAALSGHLVFSTIHTNDTCATITRLIEMGVEPFLVGSSLSLVVAQRLARRICPLCEEAAPAPVEEAARFGLRLPSDGDWRVGAGCPTCSDSGYLGRVGIFEALPIGERIKEMLLPGVLDGDIYRIGREDGLVTMWEEGLRLVSEGVTTVTEIGRVLSGARIPPEVAAGT